MSVFELGAHLFGCMHGGARREGVVCVASVRGAMYVSQMSSTAGCLMVSDAAAATGYMHTGWRVASPYRTGSC